MHKLNELYYRINALYIFYKSSHLLSKSINFYQNHKLFFELYEKLDDELDTLAELTIAVDDNDKNFNAITIFEESAKYATKTSNSFKENVELAIMQEVEILDLIEELQKEKLQVGLFNHIASISQNHLRNSYLLSRIDEK